MNLNINNEKKQIYLNGKPYYLKWKPIDKQLLSLDDYFIFDCNDFQLIAKGEY